MAVADDAWLDAGLAQRGESVLEQFVFHAATLRMRYLLSTSILLPSPRCTRRFSMRHHLLSRSTTISVTRLSSSRRARASITRTGTGLFPPWACHHWPA